MSFSGSAHEVGGGGSQWQARALRRSLEDAQARSVERMERLVTAARDLANESGSAAFTVVQVAERAGLSLKSFYRCFSGKDDLLLALLEEDSGVGASLLRGQVDRHRAPTERLRAYVEGIFDLLTHPGAAGYGGVLLREHRRLGEDRPDELRAALHPLVGMLADELTAAAKAGVVPDGDVARTADLLFGVVLMGVGEVTLGGADPHDVAAHVWRFCWGGLRGEGPRRRTAREPRRLRT